MKTGLFTILYSMDKSIWGDRVNPNKYLSTLSLLFCMLIGIIWGGSRYIESLFDWNIEVSLTASLAMVCVLIGYNIAESIIATDSAKIALLRTLMMLVIMVLGFVAGLIGSVILLAILTLVIAIYLFITFIQLLLNGGPNDGKRRWKLDNGDVVTEQKGLMGESYYRGSSGKDYDTNNGGDTFCEK